MKAITSEQMRRLDQAAIEDYGIPSLLLMENAGIGVSQLILREYKIGRVIVVVGKGNNGGDGFVVARHLANHGWRVQVVLLTDPARLKADPLVNFAIVQKMKIPLISMSEPDVTNELLKLCQNADLVVDAIFGIGINSSVGGLFASAIKTIQKSGLPVVSIDIPSGLDADSGKVCGVTVKATWTATLGMPKRGLYEGEGPLHSGKIEIIDIGIPRELLEFFVR